MTLSYSDFKQLIDGYPLNGYKVVLERTTLNKEGWTAEHYLEHIENIERHKQETGATVHYVSTSFDGRISNVDVFIYLPSEGNQPRKQYVISWKVMPLV